ncbi:MAG: SRPBCC family protein [Prevotella sp.]|nr:SRPBCC family protein [Prevotella sp.]
MKEASEVRTIYAPVERVYAVLSDLENIRPVINRMLSDEAVQSRMPEDRRDEINSTLRNAGLSRDRIEVSSPLGGTMSMVIAGREENKCVKYATEKSPVGARIWVQMLPQGASQTAVKVTAEVDVPAFLKPVIGSRVKTGAEQLADALTHINYQE